jgi:chorismate mutase
MEALTDLLAEHADAKGDAREAPRIREDAAGNTIVMGVREIAVNNAEDVCNSFTIFATPQESLHWVSFQNLHRSNEIALRPSLQLLLCRLDIVHPLPGA